MIIKKEGNKKESMMTLEERQSNNHDAYRSSGK